jgi:hypothetical protein
MSTGFGEDKSGDGNILLRNVEPDAGALGLSPMSSRTVLYLVTEVGNMIGTVDEVFAVLSIGSDTSFSRR